MPPCIHMKKMALFLLELERKKSVTPDTQETYEYYHKKNQFWDQMNYLMNKGFIIIKENNGVATIKKNPGISNEIFFSLVLSIFNYLCDLDVKESYRLHP